MHGRTLSRRRDAGATTRWGVVPFLAMTLVTAGAGCKRTTAADAGGVSVSVSTSGGDLDQDGYDLLLDNSLVRRLLASERTWLYSVPTGSHTLALRQVADNCAVGGTNPRHVNVAPAQFVEVDFAVECVPTGLAITTRTSGHLPPAALTLRVSGKGPSLIDANGSQVVSRLLPGLYTVSIEAAGEHCRTEGLNPRDVTVGNRALTPVLFEVNCDLPVRREKIAFEAQVSSPYADTWIATVNPDGTNTTMIERGTAPAWSPDGERLLWSTSVCDYYYYSYCWGGTVVIDPETRSATRENVLAWDPAWSPQGDLIAFTACCATLVDASRLYLLTAAVWSTTSFAFQGVSEVQGATWSPNGDRVAFQCRRPTGWDICVARRDGTQLTTLTTDHVLRRDLAWSPDGTQIAFTSSPTVNHIGLLTLATGAFTDLGTGSTPAWSPDGSRLVFAGDNGLFMMNADGSNRIRLTTGSHSAPAWRP